MHRFRSVTVIFLGARASSRSISLLMMRWHNFIGFTVADERWHSHPLCWLFENETEWDPLGDGPFAVAVASMPTRSTGVCLSAPRMAWQAAQINRRFFFNNVILLPDIVINRDSNGNTCIVLLVFILYNQIYIFVVIFTHWDQISSSVIFKMNSSILSV